MGRDLNKVQFTGRLGADPTFRRTSHGSELATFHVASNRSWRSAQGEPHEATEWFNVVAWEQVALLCQASLAKGSHVYVEGRLQTRAWRDDNGRRCYATEVVATHVILLTQTPKQPRSSHTEGQELSIP